MNSIPKTRSLHSLNENFLFWIVSKMFTVWQNATYLHYKTVLTYLLPSSPVGHKATKTMFLHRVLSFAAASDSPHESPVSCSSACIYSNNACVYSCTHVCVYACLYVCTYV